MTIAVDTPRERIKAWPIAAAAWGGLLRAFAGRPVTFLLTMAVYAALGAAMVGFGPLPKWLFRYAADQTTWTSGAIYLAARLVVAVVTSVILAPLLTGVPRTLLPNRVQGGWGAAARNMFFWLLALQLFATVILAGPLLASAVSFVRGMLDLIAQIGLLLLIWRLALLPPAVALGVPAKSAEWRIDASWEAMENRFWLFLKLFIFTILPMLVLLSFLSRIGLPKPPNPPPISPPIPAPLPVTKILMIGRAIAGAVQVIAIALTASTASQLYARLKRD